MTRHGFPRYRVLISAALAASLLVLAAPARAADDAASDSTSATTTAAPDSAATTAGGKKVKAPKIKKVKEPKVPDKPYAERRAAEGAWAKGSSWLSVRAGYSKTTGDFAGSGLLGYGFAFQHMLSKHWQFAVLAEHDVPQHFAGAIAVSVPMTIELTRQIKWNTPVHPYVGAGAGVFFRKYYRTSDDGGVPSGGGYITWGANTPIDNNHLIGIDFRTAIVRTRDGLVNPVFGAEKSSETQWSIKLNWTTHY